MPRIFRRQTQIFRKGGLLPGDVLEFLHDVEKLLC